MIIKYLFSPDFFYLLGWMQGNNLGISGKPDQSLAGIFFSFTFLGGGGHFVPRYGTIR
jgi:hypothetical protein